MLLLRVPCRKITFHALAVVAVTQFALGASNISPLGKRPEWSSLKQYQETITHDEFARLLQNIYCPRGVDAELILIDSEGARLTIDREEKSYFNLRFARDEQSQKPAPRSWRPATALPTAPKNLDLAGIKVAIDPGHIGGRWAQMEERWFQVGDSKPVQEGDMTLRVAKLLVPKLRRLGAKVSLVRDKAEPVTPKRPADMTEVAKQILLRGGEATPREDFSGPTDPEKEHTIRWQDELLFYRNSEIRARAEIVNAQLRPDITLCLHFNAEAWDDPRSPRLTDHNHLHLLVNGSYSQAELEYDDVRFEMLQRLLSRAHQEELPLAESSAAAMARRTELPPYEYTTENVIKVGATGYVYGRNLIANRLFQCPVVYYEPYVMNSDEVFWRIQEGDYEGIRNVNGTDRPSIYREYADGVVHGLLDYYRAARNKPRR